MPTFDIILVFALTVTGAGSVGHGGFQLSRGPGFRSRGLGEIIIGAGFLIMGWDFLSGISIVSGFGAVVAMIGTAVASGKARNGGE